MEQDDIAIKISNLTKQFGELQVLSGVDLEVKKNSIYGFLGPNGAGKTTTIKILLGLLQPSSGSVSIFGKDLNTHGLEIRRRLGYLRQNPQFYNYMTAREILRYSLKFYYNGPDKKIEDRVDLVLDLVSMSKKADREIKGFSGGERQRLGIAQAMINFPDLLILDEPAAALDPIGRRDVLNIMESLRDYTTIFYSTHILDDVQRVSDQVAILNSGQLIAEGEIDHLLTGNDGVVYDIAFRGSNKAALQRVESKDWVNTISVTQENGTNSWLVGVDDEQLAEDKLLRLLLEDSNLNVLRYTRKSYELEEVFMRLLEGEN